MGPGRLGPVRYGLSSEGPAAKMEFKLGEDAHLNIGAGLNWQGRPQVGAEIRFRF